MRRWFNMVAGIAVLTGCPGPDTDTDTQDTEDTDVVDECADYTRDVFEAVELENLCAYYITCPESIHDTVAECAQFVKGQHTQTSCWDARTARDCIEWLSTAGECATSADVDDSCNAYWTTCE